MGPDRALQKLLIDAQAIQDGHFRFAKEFHSRYLVNVGRVIEDIGATRKLVNMMYETVRNLRINAVITANQGEGYVLAHWLAAKFAAKALRATRIAGEVSLPDAAVGPRAAVLLVDDGINTGNSMKQLVARVRDMGGECVGITVAISRYPGDLNEFNVPVSFIVDLSKTYPLVNAESSCDRCERLADIEQMLRMDPSRIDLVRLKMQYMVRNAYPDIV